MICSTFVLLINSVRNIITPLWALIVIVFACFSLLLCLISRNGPTNVFFPLKTPHFIVRSGTVCCSFFRVELWWFEYFRSPEFWWTKITPLWSSFFLFRFFSFYLSCIVPDKKEKRHEKYSSFDVLQSECSARHFGAKLRCFDAFSQLRRDASASWNPREVLCFQICDGALFSFNCGFSAALIAMFLRSVKVFLRQRCRRF